MVESTCSFVSDEGVPCGKPIFGGKGLCNGHHRQQRGGRPLTPLRIQQPPSTDPTEWFLSWFDTSGGPDACHEWRRARSTDGYGKASKSMKTLYGTADTHVLKWIIANGPVPDGLMVRHIVCDNPPCGNVAHLAIGTAQDNSDDMTSKGRSRKGSSHGIAKLTEPQVLEILARLLDGESQSSIAARYGVGRTTIQEIGAGKRWKHLPRP